MNFLKKHDFFDSPDGFDGHYFFDSHCHWDQVVSAFSKIGYSPAFTFERLLASNTGGLVIPAISPSQWPDMLRHFKQLRANKQDSMVIGFAMGWHPWFLSGAEFLAAEKAISSKKISETTDYLLQLFKPYLKEEGCVAFGETGLDAQRPMPIERQLQWLEAHLQLADTYQKPVILHCVKAHQYLLPLLKRFSPRVRGVIHAFSGSYELAESYQRLGFYLGIGGACTYPRAKKIRRAIEHLPLECLLLETDAPWMPLCGLQSEPNHPHHISDVAEQVAELKQLSIANVASATFQNATDLFFS